MWMCKVCDCIKVGPNLVSCVKGKHQNPRRKNPTLNYDCAIGETVMSSEKEPRRRLSCSAYFDALWFCYTPVHQMQQYYRLGNLDNCSDKWSALYDCLILKTKRQAEVEEILEKREKTKPHIWSFRTPEEASSHWQKLYGHIYEDE